MLKIEEFDEDIFDKIYVFGDLHGSYNLFMKMLKLINLTKDDLIIILGDSCDKGRDVAKLFYKFKELKQNGYSLKHILGNHEYMMFESNFLDDDFKKIFWKINGGKETDESFREFLGYPQNRWKGINFVKELEWLKEFILKMPHILTSKSYIFVHAGYDGMVKITEQNIEFILYTKKDFYLRNNTNKEIYYGHTPNKDSKISKKPNGVYSMDTGAVYYGKLGVLEIKSKKEFYVE